MYEWIIRNELVIGLFFIVMFVGVVPILLVWWAKGLIDEIYKHNSEVVIK